MHTILWLILRLQALPPSNVFDVVLIAGVISDCDAIGLYLSLSLLQWLIGIAGRMADCPAHHCRSIWASSNSKRCNRTLWMRPNRWTRSSRTWIVKSPTVPSRRPRTIGMRIARELVSTVNTLCAVVCLWRFINTLLTLRCRPTDPDSNPYAGYQLAYEVKKLMYVSQSLTIATILTSGVCFKYNIQTKTLNYRPTSRGSGSGTQPGNGVSMPAGIADDQSKDFDFEKTEMKYDSTGMFHWSPARNLEDCILVSCWCRIRNSCFFRYKIVIR